jgi:hypothetical protein
MVFYRCSTMANHGPGRTAPLDGTSRHTPTKGNIVCVIVSFCNETFVIYKIGFPPWVSVKLSDIAMKFLISPLGKGRGGGVALLYKDHLSVKK